MSSDFSNYPTTLLTSSAKFVSQHYQQAALGQQKTAATRKQESSSSSTFKRKLREPNRSSCTNQSTLGNVNTEVLADLVRNMVAADPLILRKLKNSAQESVNGGSVKKSAAGRKEQSMSTNSKQSKADQRVAARKNDFLISTFPHKEVPSKEDQTNGQVKGRMSNKQSSLIKSMAENGVSELISSCQTKQKSVK